MKSVIKKIIFIIALLCITSKAKAQGIFIHDIAIQNINANGVGQVLRPIPGAIITICQGTAALSAPCNPTANVYTAASCSSGTLVLGSSTTTSDNNGNYGFCIDPNQYNGQYVVSISGIGITGYAYNLTIACNKVSPCTESNRTFTGALAKNNLILLNQQPQTTVLTGNGSSQTIYTYTLPANTLTGSGGLIVEVYFEGSNSTSCSFTLGFGGSNIITDTTTNANPSFFQSRIFNNGTTSTQWEITDEVKGGSQQPLGITTTNINTTSPVVINLTFNVASPNTAQGWAWLVYMVQ